jgi:hypothetical protein
LAISSIAHEHLAIKSLLDSLELIHAKTNSDLACVGKSFDFESLKIKKDKIITNL